jgi:hypothetical protein
VYYWLVAERARGAARAFPAALAWWAVEQVWCAAQWLPFVYYWLVVEQARRGASQAFLMSQLLEREQGARQ